MFFCSLETTLRNFSCLTTGDSIMVAYNNKKYYIDIVETKPSAAISIIETDCEVDFAPPLDYKEPEKPAVPIPTSKVSMQGQHKLYTVHVLNLIPWMMNLHKVMKVIYLLKMLSGCTLILFKYTVFDTRILLLSLKKTVFNTQISGAIVGVFSC